jgi:hypothetical protein
VRDDAEDCLSHSTYIHCGLSYRGFFAARRRFLQPRDARNHLFLLAKGFLTRADEQRSRSVGLLERTLLRGRREQQVGDFDRYEQRLANIYSEEVLVSSEEVFARGESLSNTLVHGQRHAPR